MSESKKYNMKIPVWLIQLIAPVLVLFICSWVVMYGNKLSFSRDEGVKVQQEQAEIKMRLVRFETNQKNANKNLEEMKQDVKDILKYLAKQ